MKYVHLLFLTLVTVVFLGFLVPQAHADGANGISIQSISVQPYAIKVGDSFTVTATLVNNSTVPIFVSDMISRDCQGPFFTVLFDNHVKVTEKEIACSYVALEERLDPDKKYAGTSPGLIFTYIATEAGTANATVTFPYEIKNQTDPNQPNIDQVISKSFLFTIYGNNTSISILHPTVPPIPSLLTPLKQFKSGIAANDVECKQGLERIIKAEDDSPACVKFSTAEMLIRHGWASSESGISSDGQRTYIIQDLPASFLSCNTPYLLSDSGMTVLYMPTNSTGKICVRYYNLNNTPVGIGMRIFEENNMTQNASDITTGASNDTLQGNENTTIIYSIKTGNKAGFYGLSLFCGGMPFAVGYDANSTLIASDFSGLERIIHSCPAQGYEYHIEGVEGIGIRYIPYP